MGSLDDLFRECQSIGDFEITWHGAAHVYSFWWIDRMPSHERIFAKDITDLLLAALEKANDENWI